ncbi:hypothetical protein C8J57DRAFT_1255557 [Mycena rebaudengoi]|nr:hypothetical protein C8J57DRAFT_1255557 [Mycena rebaudengoi]
MPPSLKGKGRRRRSKSPKVKKTKVETRVEIPPKPSKPVEEVEFVEPTKSEEIGIVSDRDANNDRVSTSGLTNDEMHAILKQKISELHELERQFWCSGAVETHSSSKAGARIKSAQGPHPARSSAEAKPPPSDPSDSSSSSSSDDESGSSRRGASSPRLSSKRRRGHARKQKMLLKPIPPSRYNGEPNANAIQRFARESKTYVKMGSSRRGASLFHFILPRRKALDFYNQIVTVDEESWTLKRFFVELFEFCFPIDFRNMQRKRLNRCFQAKNQNAKAGSSKRPERPSRESVIPVHRVEIFPCGFRGRGRGGRVNSSPRQREEVMRTSAVGAPPKNKPAKSEMSAQQRNDMLARAYALSAERLGIWLAIALRRILCLLKIRVNRLGLTATRFTYLMPPLRAMHCAMHFGDISGVDEGGEPLQTFGGSESEFELDSDHSSQHDVDSADGDAPSCAIGDLYALYVPMILQYTLALFHKKKKPSLHTCLTRGGFPTFQCTFLPPKVFPTNMDGPNVSKFQDSTPKATPSAKKYSRHAERLS